MIHFIKQSTGNNTPVHIETKIDLEGDLEISANNVTLGWITKSRGQFKRRILALHEQDTTGLSFDDESLLETI